MDNYIIKTLAYNKQVRILFVENTGMISELCNDEKFGETLKIALGRTVSITTLISGILKGNQRISIKVNCTGGNYKLLADADSRGNVRGYINDALLNTHFNRISNSSVKELIGDKGYIQVMKDLGMNNTFTGITAMPYGNIIDDFSYYFKQSEQLPSLFSLNLVFNDKEEIILSRGILAQVLPGASIKLIDNIKEIISKNQHILTSTESYNDFKDIPKLLFDDIEILDINSVQLFCGCSKEILYFMLYSLGNEELIIAYKDGKPVEIVCNNCGKKYQYNKEEIKVLIGDSLS